MKALPKTDKESELHERAQEQTMPNVYRAGDQVATTGVYKAIHAGQHAEPHYVMAAFGGEFPACLECVDNVRFELALSAVNVNAHPQFKR